MTDAPDASLIAFGLVWSLMAVLASYEYLRSVALPRETRRRIQEAIDERDTARREASAHKARADLWKRRAAEMGFIATTDDVRLTADGFSLSIEGTKFPCPPKAKERPN